MIIHTTPQVTVKSPTQRGPTSRIVNAVLNADRRIEKAVREHQPKWIFQMAPNGSKTYTFRGVKCSVRSMNIYSILPFQRPIPRSGFRRRKADFPQILGMMETTHHKLLSARRGESSRYRWAVPNVGQV